MNVLYIKSYYLLLITYYQAGEARAARGIVAEPCRAKRTRGAREGMMERIARRERSEAARPNPDYKLRCANEKRPNRSANI
jgi:hypothetical protein